MKKIGFGIAVMLFGLTLYQYVNEGWLVCVTALLGLGFAAWGAFFEEKR